MKDKNINDKVEELYELMLEYWRTTHNIAGFSLQHEQDLYDAICKYKAEE